MALRDFEVEIIRRFTAKGTHRIPEINVGASPKGEWIRGHLLDVGSDYIYLMWKRWCKFTEAEKDYVKIRAGTYLSFAKYIWILKRLGLIRKVASATSARKGFKRSIYEVVPELVDDPRWMHPYQALYESTRWWAKQYPKRTRERRRKY